jgi:hypothetical protein
LRFWVHKPDAKPYSVSFAMAIASSSEENFCTVRTGPKISCRMSAEVDGSSENTAGATK